jgi:hypothetical protein
VASESVQLLSKCLRRAPAPTVNSVVAAEANQVGVVEVNQVGVAAERN